MRGVRYTDSHEWVRPEDDGTVTIGITEYAQEQLGDIVFVQLPEIGAALNSGDEAAVIESVYVEARDTVRTDLERLLDQQRYDTLIGRS